MPSQFDELIDRRHTGSVKWHQQDDTIPMWIADMDFKAAEPILAAINRVNEHGVLGYVCPQDSLYRAIINWHQTHYGLSLDKSHIIFSPGVVPSISLMINVLTNAGDAVLINEPVYAPFFHKVKQNQRQLITSSLIERGQRYYLDFADIEQKIKQHKVALFILCNPHNPGGRVWSKEELTTLLALCKRYHVAVLSDEIHQDLTLSNHTFTPVLSLVEDDSQPIASLTSVTKTFNIAGIKSSMIFAKNRHLLDAIRLEQRKRDEDDLNLFAYVATESAYTHAEPWLKEALAYIEDNIEYTLNFFKEHLPALNVMRPEASYLIWFDCSAYYQDNKLLQETFKQAKIQLNEGLSYGESGNLYMRLNVACPHETLMAGLTRIQSALTSTINS